MRASSGAPSLTAFSVTPSTKKPGMIRPRSMPRFTSTDRRVDATIRLLRLRSLFHPRMHRLSDRYGLSLESFRRIRRVFLPTNRTRLPSLFIYRLKIYNPDQNTKLYFPQASPEKHQPQIRGNRPNFLSFKQDRNTPAIRGPAVSR